MELESSEDVTIANDEIPEERPLVTAVHRKVDSVPAVHRKVDSGTPGVEATMSTAVQSSDAVLPCAAATADQSDGEILPTGDDEEEVEQGRPARTRKPPEGMTPEEMRNYSLTHIPFHPGCRSCVAGRMRDHQHPR